MKTRSKVLLLIVSALALVIATIFGTLAYLTDTETVENTFTVGHVDIILNEAKVNEDGTVVENEDRVAANKYHLIPGHVYTKDPTVTVHKKSEECYVRMLVTVKDFDDLRKVFTDKNATDYFGTDDVFLLQKLCGGWDSTKWEYHSFNEETDTYEFRYYRVVGSEGGKRDNHESLEPLFTSISLPGPLFNNADMDKIKDVEITVVAHAIQADGFADANAAWASWQDNGSYTIETE